MAKVSAATKRRRAAAKQSKRRRQRKRWFSRPAKLTGLVAAGLCLLAAMHATDPTTAHANQAQQGEATHSTATAVSAATASPLSEVAVVQKSFAATGATADSALVHDYTLLNQTFMTPQTLAEMGQQIKQELEIQQAKLVTRNESGERLWEVCGVLPGHTVVTVVLSSFVATGQQSATSVLTVSEQLASSDVSRIGSDMQALDDLLIKFGMTPQLSTCMSGFVGARLGDVPPKTLVDSAFAAVQAREVEGVSSALVTSISGDTPETSWHIETGGGAMNLQVGVHYDSVLHATRVVVGSPIIVTTY